MEWKAKIFQGKTMKLVCFLAENDRLPCIYEIHTKYEQIWWHTVKKFMDYT